MKPGYTTTEFWTTLLMHVITIVTLFNVPLNTSQLSSLVPVAALVASAIAQAYYSHSRGTVKAANADTVTTTTTTTAGMAPTTTVVTGNTKVITPDATVATPTQ